MARLVVDASVSAAWFLEDEASPYCDIVLDHVAHEGARVPCLWTYEMANVLTFAARRGRLEADRMVDIHTALGALPVQVDEAVSLKLLPAWLRVASAHGLTAYDAAYLELAERTGSRLATRDAALRTAAERAGVSLLAGDVPG